MSNCTITSFARNILLVEDEIYLLQFLTYLLESRGFKVITAVDGQEAVDLFKNNNNIDLVLMDIMMPKKDGITAYNEIKELDPNARILLMSGYSTLLIEETEIAPVNMIQKPMLPEALITRINYILHD